MRKLWPLLGAFALAAGSVRASDNSPAASEKAARGKYLVEEVAKCQDCHTPRLEKGEFDTSKWLQGTVLGFQPLNEVAGWHKASPNITPTGNLWKRWGEAGLVNYLKTGLNPRGNPADPPMPGYKLRADDAEAIVEYLKTLK